MKYNKIVISIAIALISITAAFGQVNLSDSTVSVVPYFSIPDSITYRAIEEELRINGNDTIINVHCEHDFMLKVIDSIADGNYKLEYRIIGVNDSNYVDKRGINIPLRFYNAIKNIPIHISLSKMGNIESIEDLEVLKKAYKEVTEEWLNEMYQKNDSMNQIMPREKIETMLSLQLANPSGIASLLTDLSQTFSLHGAMYPYEHTSINKIDKSLDSYAATITQYAGNHPDKNPANGYFAYVKVEQELPESEANILMTGVMESLLSSDKNQTIERLLDGMDFSNIEISNCWYNTYFEDGWPQTINNVNINILSVYGLNSETHQNEMFSGGKINTFYQYMIQ